MEKTMDQLTTAQMVELFENKPVEEKSSASLSAMEAVKATAARVRMASERINVLHKAMPQVLAFLDEAQASDVANELSDIGGMTWGQVAQQLESGINAKLASDSPAERRAVCLPLLLRQLDLPEADETAAAAALDWAVKDKFLQPAQGAAEQTFGVWDKRYALSNEFGLEASDKKQLEALLENLCRKASKLKPPPVKLPVSPPPAKPRSSSEPITPGQAWRGELGKFDLPIPPSNGKDKGKTLHLEHKDGGILSVRGANGDSVNFPFSAIRDEQGGIRSGLKLVVPRLQRADSEKWRARMERVGEELKRGFRLAMGLGAVEPKTFLKTLVAGDSVLVFNGFDWDPPDSRKKRMFQKLALRFRRRDDGQVALVEICTPGAEDLFEDFLGKYYEPGEKFSEMPLELGVFLRVVYGQVVQGRVYQN